MRNRTWLTIIGMVLFVAYVMAFNYGGCGSGGESDSGSSTPLVQAVITNPATDVTQTTALLNGTVNPNGVSTNVYFQFGTNITYGSTTVSQNIGFGTVPVNVSAAITGLSPNTIYNFRIRATIGGTTGIVYNGANQTFTTAGLPPTCTTNPAINITNNSATLNGAVNPNGVNVTACYFNYGTTQSYGSTATATPSPGSGTSPVSVSANISSLSVNTEYNFRVVGTSNFGTTYGNNLIFSTGAPSGSAPTCTTNPSNNSYNSAILNGTVIPNGLSTNAYFQWGLTVSYDNTTTSQAIGNGIASVVVTANISGLSSNKGYNFRIVGTNSAGITYGNNLTFNTAPPPPTCTTNAATNVASTSATLNGTVNPNGIDTTAYFLWGITTSYENTTSQAIGSGTRNVNVTANISGLSASTLYNFKIFGANSSGTNYGNNLTFTTAALPRPSSTTNAASNIGITSATLNGTVNPNGLNVTSCIFQYGTTESYSSQTNAVPSSFSTASNVSASISSLSASTLYNFRVVATNAGGTAGGLNLTFTTSALPPPTCTTNAPSSIGATSATLNGIVNPNGVNVTSCYFNYGTTQSYGNTATATPSPGSGTSPVSVSASISLLSVNTEYNFRIVATNAGGTTNGLNQTFTTSTQPLPTCTTNAATNVTNNAATLNGTVNPNGLTVTPCIFQYGTTESYGSQTNASPYSFSATSDVSANIISLSASTLYNFRVVATNAGGTTNGSNQTFTTSALPPPTCTTNAASSISATYATLNGTVNPNGYNVTACYFDYATGTTPPTYGSQQNAASLPGSGTSPVSVSATIISLSASTLYNFRVVATNVGGTTNGLNQSFTTIAPPPSATTTAATNVASTSATLNGTVNPNGLTTNVYFNYGLTTSYGSSTTQQNIGSGTSNVNVPANITGLSPNTTYNFQVVATNSTGTTYGTNLTFTTTAGSTTAVDDYVWVANYGSNTVTRIQKADTEPPTPPITVGTQPWGVAVDETYVWVSNYGAGSGNTVTRIQKSNLSTTTITVGTGPTGLAVDETYCWVANETSNNVTRILKSNSTTTTIAVGTNPEGVAVDGTYCWVANYTSNNVTRILKSNSTTTTIAVGTNPNGVAVDETYVWVANYGSANVTRIQKSNSATTTIAVGTYPWGVAVDGTYCYVTDPIGSIIYLISKSNSALYSIAAGNDGPVGVAVDATYLWVANNNYGDVSRILKSDYTTIQYIGVGTTPYSLGDMTGYAYDNYSRVP